MKKRRGLVNRGDSRKSRHQVVPFMERVEDRVLMAVFTVINTSDAVNATAGDGSLRGEILASNATTTANMITFNLPTGAQTITPVAPLPIITDSVIIDGTTQPGFTNAPLIRISGTKVNQAASGLVIQAPTSEVRDLIIDNFNGDGIDLNGGTGLVDGCYIGVNAAGGAIAANSGVGILVASQNNTIGATTSANPNVISGNTTGILVNGANATKNSIIHNYIGTDATGTLPLGNIGTTGTGNGIELDAGNNTIGGVSVSGPRGVGNLISGNDMQILISGTSATRNLVQGNYLSTDHTGTIDIDSSGQNGVAGSYGIYITGAAQNQIGGQVAGSGNVMVNGVGIYLNGSGTTGTQVYGNSIGVGSDGVTPVGHISTGVVINGASLNQIGGTALNGTDATFGNIIQNWSVDGVQVVGASGDAILSNSIYSTLILNNAPPNNNLGIFLSAANGGVRPPTIISAQSGAGMTRVAGTYSASPNTSYRIQFFDSQLPNPNGFGDGQNFLGDLDIRTNSVGTFNFSTLLPMVAPVGYVLSATATQGVLVRNNTSEFSQDVPITLAPVSDLAVTTSVPTTGPLISQPYTYTLTVTNSGPNDATGVILTDTIPTNSTFLASSAGTASNGVVTDNIGNLASGASVTVTITVDPTAVGPFVNTATVTGDDIDPNSTNNTSITTGVVALDADLSIVLIPSATLSPVGTPLNYTLSVGNNGPSVATATVVTVQFPADFTNIVVMPDQGSYTINPDNSVTINLGIVPASSSINVQFTATPTAVESAVTTASVSSPVIDPNNANNQTSATVLIGNAADLGISVTTSPSPALIGQDLIFTAVVSNNGPSAASQPAVTDVLPAGLTFVSASAGSDGTATFDPATDTVTASFNALLAGGSYTLTIDVRPSVSALITNTLTVGDPNLTTPAEIDPDLTNNTATVVVPISPADLSIVVNNPTDPLFIGSDAVFQVVVTNNGTADASNVAITDTFTNGTIVAVSNGGFNATNFGVTLGSLAAGQMMTISIIVDPTTSGSLTSTASVSADQYDPDRSNNTSSSSNLVNPADIAVTVAGSTAPVLFGQPVLFVVTVTNNGPATATNVLFSDALPADAILGGLVASQGHVAPSADYTAVYGNLGTLASGASATVTIYVQPLATGTATDAAGAVSDDFDPVPANNASSLSIPVINLPGSIQFASGIQTVAENAGYVVLLVQRTGGTLGAVSVHYATQDYTALAGVNYVSSSGTLTFQDGQSYAAIIIPVLDDFKVDGNNGFFVVLSSPSGGASVGQQAVSGVVVVNTDRDLVPPAITSLVAIPNGQAINGFVLTFDKAMDPARASLVSNYYVFLQGNGNSQLRVPLVAALYNASNNTVTLVPSAPLPGNVFYQVIANGSVGLALTDISGNVLYGSSGPNSNYDAFYGQGTRLVYDDSENNLVTLNLTGGGFMGIYRAANGDAAVVNLFAVVPHSTRLTGNVQKLNKFGSGHTFIGQINGFGRFGDVNSTLTTPQFYVGSAPVSAFGVGAGVAVAADSVTTPKAVHKKATPKGPHHAKR